VCPFLPPCCPGFPDSIKLHGLFVACADCCQYLSRYSSRVCATHAHTRTQCVLCLYSVHSSSNGLSCFPLSCLHAHAVTGSTLCGLGAAYLLADPACLSCALVGPHIIVCCFLCCVVCRQCGPAPSGVSLTLSSQQHSAGVVTCHDATVGVNSRCCSMQAKTEGTEMPLNAVCVACSSGALLGRCQRSQLPASLRVGCDDSAVCFGSSLHDFALQCTVRQSLCQQRPCSLLGLIAAYCVSALGCGCAGKTSLERCKAKLQRVAAKPGALPGTG
jgi:hypothetical protein